MNFYRFKDKLEYEGIHSRIDWAVSQTGIWYFIIIPLPCGDHYQFGKEEIEKFTQDDVDKFVLECKLSYFFE